MKEQRGSGLFSDPSVEAFEKQKSEETEARFDLAGYRPS
jgi:hypothetical protein